MRVLKEDRALRGLLFLIMAFLITIPGMLGVYPAGSLVEWVALSTLVAFVLAELDG